MTQTHKLNKQVHMSRKAPFAYVQKYFNEVAIIDTFKTPIVPVSARHPFKPVTLHFEFAPHAEAVRFCGTWIESIELTLN